MYDLELLSQNVNNFNKFPGILSFSQPVPASNYQLICRDAFTADSSDFKALQPPLCNSLEDSMFSLNTEIAVDSTTHPTQHITSFCSRGKDYLHIKQNYKIISPYEIQGGGEQAHNHVTRHETSSSKDCLVCSD